MHENLCIVSTVVLIMTMPPLIGYLVIMHSIAIEQLGSAISTFVTDTSMGAILAIGGSTLGYWISIGECIHCFPHNRSARDMRC